MKTTAYTLVIAVPLLLLVGCVIGDELTTLTIQPDGSAEYVILRSNLHSTEVGEKADKEIAEYKARFDARSDDDLARIEAAGGSVVATTWIREEAPMSNVVHARFPDASALEKFWTVRSDDGKSQIATQFTNDGLHRKLTVRVQMPQEGQESTAAVDLKEYRQSLANGVSVTRIAVAGGSITGARGFIIANDRQSAVLNNEEVEAALREGHGTAELYLAWDVTE